MINLIPLLSRSRPDAHRQVEPLISFSLRLSTRCKAEPVRQVVLAVTASDPPLKVKVMDRPPSLTPRVRHPGDERPRVAAVRHVAAQRHHVAHVGVVGAHRRRQAAAQLVESVPTLAQTLVHLLHRRFRNRVAGVAGVAWGRGARDGVDGLQTSEWCHCQDERHV